MEEKLNQKTQDLSDKVVALATVIENLKQNSIFYDQDRYSVILQDSIRKAIRDDEKIKHLQSILIVMWINLAFSVLAFICIASLLMWLAK